MRPTALLRSLAAACLLVALAVTTAWAMPHHGARLRDAASSSAADKGKGKHPDTSGKDQGKGDKPKRQDKPAASDDQSDGAGDTPGAAPVPVPASTTAPASTAVPSTTTPPAPAAPAPAAPAQGDAPSGLAPAVASPASPLVAGLETGRRLGVAELRGEVFVRAAGADAIQPVGADAVAVAPGTVVDARQGAVALATSVAAGAAPQVAHFSGGIFEVRQAPGGTGVTQIVLRHGDFSHCAAATAAAPRSGASAHAATRHKPIRSLWGSDHHGRFQTHGRGSVATVRGTRWLTEDFCDGTRTTVKEGAVAVRDLALHRTVVVHAGHSYFARRAAR
jgi:hypothetical protein